MSANVLMKQRRLAWAQIMVFLERGFRFLWIKVGFGIPEILTACQHCPQESTEVLRLHLRGWWCALPHFWLLVHSAVECPQSSVGLNGLAEMSVSRTGLLPPESSKKTYFLWATLALDASWGEGKSSCWNKCHCFSQWVRVTCLHQWAAGLAHPLSFTVSPSSVLWNWALFWGCKLQWNMWGDAFAL